MPPHVWTEEDVAALSIAMKKELNVTIASAQLERDGVITIWHTSKGVSAETIQSFIKIFEKTL